MPEIINTLPENQQMATIKPKKVIIKKKTIQHPELQLQNQITFTTMKEKGDVYEKFIKKYLIDSGEYEWVYLWNETPMRYLIDSKIFTNFETIIKDDREIIKYGGFQLDEYNRHTELNKLQDLGIDLVALHKSGKYVIIQCKFYQDTIDKNSMAGFHTYFLDCIKTNPNIEGIAYITRELAPNLLKITRRNGIQYIIKEFDNSFIDSISNYEDKNIILEPRQYQLDAINALKDKDRGILSMACGLGKTLVSILLSKMHNIVLVLSPLKAYAEQNERKFKSQLGDEYNTLIIDSDYTRDSDIILKFIKDNKKCCIFSTFKSCDKILEIIKKYPNSYIIVDEFHNLTRNDALPYNINDDNEQSDLNKLLYNKKNRIIFMSATPRIMGDNKDDGVEIDENIFGKIEYQYTLGNAIKNKMICDYEIIVPSISINQTNGIEELNNFMINKNFNKNLLIKARFIIKGMLETGSQKCIIYLQDQTQAKEFNQILREVAFNYFGKYIWSDTLIYNDTINSRKQKIKQFEETNNILSFLCNVHILNEAIDIPSCDSIFLVNNSDNKIRTIQRISRATRLDKNNPNKKAKIFVWCDNYKDDLATFISNIKEYDETFKFDTKMTRFNSNSWNNISMNKNIESNEYENLQNIIIGIKGFSTYKDRRQLIYDFVAKENYKPLKDGKTEHERQLARYFADYEKIFNSKTGIMKNETIYNDWKTLKNSFGFILLSNKELWHARYKQLMDFIRINKRMPIRTIFNKEEEDISSWITENENQYKIKDRALSNPELWNIWDKFKKDYDYLINEKYYTFVNEIKTYSDFCDTFQRCPLFEDENERELNAWFNKKDKQYENHKNNKKFELETKTWEEFWDKYKILFAERRKKMFEIENILKLQKLDQAANNNSKMPNSMPINTIDALIIRIQDIRKFYNKFKIIPEEKKKKLENMSDDEYQHMKIFGKWIDGAKTNFNKNDGKGIGFMENPDAREIFQKFLIEFNIITEEQDWLNSYEIVLNNAKNNIYPHYDIDSKIYNWVKHNKKKYDINNGKGIINKYTNLRKKFKYLIVNFPKLFINNEKIKDENGRFKKQI